MEEKIFDKIKTHASIILCDDILDIKEKLLIEIKANSKDDEIKIFEKASDKDTINFSISEARELLDFQKTKSDKKRFIVINKKFTRSEGQSAILKVLEEADKKTFIMILSDNIINILPTIISRSVLLDIRTDKNINNYKSKLIKNKDYKSLERVLILESAVERGSISARYVDDFLKVVL